MEENKRKLALFSPVLGEYAGKKRVFDIKKRYGGDN